MLLSVWAAVVLPDACACCARSAIAAPLAARQEAHLELFGRPCRCSRCSLEATLPAEASQQLQSVYDKAQGEWPQRLQATLEAADEAGAEQTAELLAELQVGRSIVKQL